MALSVYMGPCPGTIIYPHFSAGEFTLSCVSYSLIYSSTQGSVAVVITDVFRKKRINVSNKFVRIMKIFTKINDLKNCGVI